MLTLPRIQAALWTAVLAVVLVGIGLYAFVALNSAPTPDPQLGRTYEVHWKQYGIEYLTEDQGRVIDGLSTLLLLIIVITVPALFVTGGIQRVRERRAAVEMSSTVAKKKMSLSAGDTEVSRRTRRR
jgi:uncharacterized protein YybS (DUF2232 family)